MASIDGGEKACSVVFESLQWERIGRIEINSIEQAGDKKGKAS